MRFIFTHSHAFPNGRVAVADDGETGPEGLVEFADGTVIVAHWRRVDDAVLLSIPAYRTAKGTDIPARDWQLVEREGTWRSTPR